jgi:hypothetical protein
MTENAYLVYICIFVCQQIISNKLQYKETWLYVDLHSVLTLAIVRLPGTVCVCFWGNGGRLGVNKESTHLNDNTQGSH